MKNFQWLSRFSGALALAGLLSLCALPQPAWAVNLGCLLGSRGCEGSAPSGREKWCAACFYAEVNYKGAELCVDVTRGWDKLLGLRPMRSVKLYTGGCGGNADLYLVQGETADAGAVKILPDSVPDIASAAPGWTQFTFASVRPANSHKARPVSIEPVLPKLTRPNYDVFARRNQFIAFPFSNPQATNGVPLPKEGSIVAYETTDLPGGCIPVGELQRDAKFTLPPKTGVVCRGMVGLVPNRRMGGATVRGPGTVCSFQTTSGTSVIEVHPVDRLQSVEGGPRVNVGPQPTLLRLEGTMSSGSEQAVAGRAFYINLGANAVFGECKVSSS